MQVHYLAPVLTTSKYTSESGAGAIPKLSEDLQTYYKEINVHIINGFSYAWDSQPQNELNARADALLSGVKEDDILIMSSPTNYNSQQFIDTIVDHAHRTFGAKVVGFTFDLTSFRHVFSSIKNSGHSSFVKNWSNIEINFLNKCDAIIAQTNEMAQAIFDNFGYSGPIVVQGPWGYITSKAPAPKQKDSSLLFAGSPGKAQYLKSLASNLTSQFNIFSDFTNTHAGIEAPDFDSTWTNNLKPNINLHDTHIDASYVDQIISGGFGLIWDSFTYPNVTGGFGQYMQMAMPHKFSMYTVAGIPSVVWSKSCLAPLVEKKKIGWAINDLTELDDLIQNTSPEEYFERTNNLSLFSDLIRTGFYSKKVIFDLINVLYVKGTRKM